MVVVSNADRVVFPAVNKTKGDVVAYYERIAQRLLPHVAGRPLSMKRYPKGLAGAGFFQKNVPDHYPDSIARFSVPRSAEASKKHPRKAGKAESNVTTFPVLSLPEHLPYVANQGAIELHVPMRRIESFAAPDRIVIDLDPPEGEFARARRAAFLVRDVLLSFGLESVPVATGSKGYHVVAPVAVPADATWEKAERIFTMTQKLAALLAHRHPDDMTMTFRVNKREGKTFVDWLRNAPNATVVSPYSLRARPRATVAAPLTWDELSETPPDAFAIDDVQRLLDREDALAGAEKKPGDASAFADAVERAFEEAGLVLETFDRFRS
jgi:bifunctional non-homologous end joining protein LigD